MASRMHMLRQAVDVPIHGYGKAILYYSHKQLDTAVVSRLWLGTCRGPPYLYQQFDLEALKGQSMERSNGEAYI